MEIGTSMYLTFAFPSANKFAAQTYLKNMTSEAGTFSEVQGFSLRFNSKDFTYHSSMERAFSSKWSTPTSFSSSKEAFNSLALDYPQTTNFAQQKFTLHNWGVYVKGAASRQGASLGGGIQLLKTPFSLKTNIQQVPFKLH